MTSAGLIPVGVVNTGAPAVFAMSHRFLLVVDHPEYNLGFWHKVSGLTVTWDVATYRANDQGNAYWIYPGTTKYQNIKLTRPISANSTVTQKWLTSTSADMTPLSGSITLCASSGAGLISWQLRQFFPVSWQVGELTAESGKVVTETLELAHTGFLNDQVASQSLPRKAGT